MKRKKTFFIVLLIVVFFIVFFVSSLRSNLVRQLQGPTEGTDNVLTIDNKIAIVSKNNHVYTWQWNDLSKWPVVAKLQAYKAAPLANDRIVYIPLVNHASLILTDLRADKKLADLSLSYAAESKKIKTSPNGRLAVVSVLFEEGQQKGLFKLGLFDSDLKDMSFVFQKDTKAEDFLVYDFDITNDGEFIAGAGEKGQAWIFITDVKNKSILWEKVFSEYSRFTSVKFSPDGKMLFVAEKVRYIVALDSATGQSIKVFEMPLYNTPAHQRQNVCCIAVSPDGRTLAADTEPARIVWFWDIATGKKIGTIYASNLTVSEIAFSPDSKYLSTGCMVSPEIKIWKVPQPKP
jgi:WD40 repeat protein